MKLNNLNLNAVLHFNCIAKHKSLSLAAKELNLSAPAITHSLNNLENTLNEKLCVRSRSGFQLTPAGTRLYQASQKIISELEGFARNQEDENQFSGILSIGILDHFEHSQFEEVLLKTSQKFPLLKFNIQSYDSDTINRLILERELDIGVGTFSHRSPRLRYLKIGEERLRYYISKNHPLWKKKVITKEDLVGQKTTWLDNHNRTRFDLETHIFVENLKYKMQFFGFSNNLSGAVQILLSGHAIVPLPEDFGDSVSKSRPIKKIELETKSKILDQVMAFNPSDFQSAPAKFITSFFH